MTDKQQLTLNEKVLLAAFALQKGDIKNKFTAEDLLVEVWQQDKGAFGLRNYENKYPDSNKLFTKLDGKGGLVRKGLLKKVSERTYILTPAGMSLSNSIRPVDEITTTKVNRELYEEIKKIINHPIFSEWLKDSNKPEKFRDAGWFWGIAPGNPPSIVAERLANIEQNLIEAKKKTAECGGKLVLDTRGMDQNVKLALTTKGNANIDSDKSKIYLDSKDINKCIEFHELLKKRFEKELSIMLKKK
ncbi:MAG: hypothetical protein JXC85_06225 [Candidatus Aenigmarchaeota archaeon]|nr:hypothetical protein [Candidatus Aenigmarchaeota archaeon]